MAAHVGAANFSDAVAWPPVAVVARLTVVDWWTVAQAVHPSGMDGRWSLVGAGGVVHSFDGDGAELKQLLATGLHIGATPARFEPTQPTLCQLEPLLRAAPMRLKFA